MATVEQEHYELPNEIRKMAGEINDLDAHEAIPPGLWTEVFGPDMQQMMDAVEWSTKQSDAPLSYGFDLKREETEIRQDTAFRVKMENAPGAFELDKRLKLLDFVGIRRQIVFPGGLALNAQGLYADADNSNIFQTIPNDRKTYARRCIDAYNDWCVRSWNSDRLLMVAVLVGDTVDELETSLRSLLDRGIRVFQLNSSVPPAGLSPAHPDLDRVWALAEEAGANLMLHLDAGVVTNFIRTEAWQKAPAFEGWLVGAELSLDPWTLNNLHLAPANFISTLVLGGVFDRFPGLHIGCQELGAGWIGPLAENMDLWYGFTPLPSTIGERKLKMKPSDYVRRHVRVAPFYNEPVGHYIDLYGLDDVYCFASDLPHIEGGKQPYEDFVASLKGHSPGTFRKFFVDNAKAIMP